MEEGDQELDEMHRQSIRNKKTNKSFVARKSENSRLVWWAQPYCVDFTLAASIKRLLYSQRLFSPLFDLFICKIVLCFVHRREKIGRNHYHPKVNWKQ